MGMEKGSGLNFGPYDYNSGSGGGGGGDVVEKKLQYPVMWDMSSYKIDVTSGSCFKPFNVDNNKLIGSTGGYGGGIFTLKLNDTSGYTRISTVNDDVPSLGNIAIAEDDSFFIYYYNGKLNYVPVNPDYTTGTIISVKITDLGYGTNIWSVCILSSTRFAFWDQTNSKIGIFKLEGGALVEDKSIDGTNFNLTNNRISSFKGYVVLIVGYSGNTVGIRILDVDTEQAVYEDLRTDKTNMVYACYQKDNYLFAECANNTTPYVTTPLIIYEYSNGQISKKATTPVNFDVKQYAGNTMSVYKKSEGLYIITTSISVRTELMVMICDMINGTIETTLTSATNLSASYICVVTQNNESRLMLVRSEGSYPSYVRGYYGNYYLTKVPTEIEYNSNGYSLTTLSQV